MLFSVIVTVSTHLCVVRFVFCCLMSLFQGHVTCQNNFILTGVIQCIQLFQERLSEKMCTRQPRKVIWDMINTLFLTTVAVKTNLFTFLWHSRTYVRGLPCQISSNFFEEQGTQNYPQYLSGLSRALFPTTFLEIPVCKNLLGHIWQNEQRDLCCCCCFYFQTFRVLFSSYLTLCYLWEGLLHTCYVM